MGAADGNHRHRRRCQLPKGELVTDISMGAPADTNDTSPSTATLRFLETDPLAEMLCVRAGPPTWLILVDPMLDELASSLIVSQPAVTLAPGCLHAAASVPQEGQASLVDTSSPVMATQCAMNPPSSSPVQDMPWDNPLSWVLWHLGRIVRLGHLGSNRTSTWRVLRRHKMAIQLAKPPDPSTSTKDETMPDPSNATPMSCEATWCLPRFAKEVQLK
jgi:hypothetical protein